MGWAIKKKVNKLLIVILTTTASISLNVGIRFNLFYSQCLQFKSILKAASKDLCSGLS